MSRTTMATTSDATTPRARPSQTFRADVEGLRAVAVVLVVLDHMLLVPTGGFIGVDVFFVISGFLITGLLLREHRRTGTVAFGQFYLRRVKRIAPAALLVVLTTVAVGLVLLSIARAGQVAKDGLFAVFFVANWNFAGQGTDYFLASQDLSPLQHYWSLSVEEQFYVVWPWATLVLLTLGGRVLGGRRLTAVVAGTFGAVAVASFVWACLGAASDPAFAYFDTFGRVWELAVGALLAVAVPALGRIPGAARTAMAYLGLAGIVGGALLLTSDLLFPGPWALVPVVATALVIVSGTGGRARGLWPLTNVVTRYVGRVSFSLYLWHFPVIVYLSLLLGRDHPAFVPVASVGMLVLSVASHHLVEEPLRRLELPKRRRSPREPSPATSGEKIAVGGLAFVAMGCVALVTVAFAHVAPAPSRAPATVAGPTVAPSAPEAGAVADPEGDRTEALQDALAADAWPALVPDVSAFGGNGRAVIASEWITDGCLGEDDALLTDAIANPEHCSYGNQAADAAHTAVVYGDSVAISYLPGVRQALGPEWKVQAYTLAACPTSAAPTTRVNGSRFPECGDFRAWALDQIVTLDPALVVLSEASDDNRLLSGATGADAASEWSAGATETFTRLRDLSGTVLSLSRPPVGTSLYECQTALSSPRDCVSEVTEGYQARSSLMRRAAEQVGGAVSYRDTSTWFCNLGECPVFVGTTPVLADGRHLTNGQSVDIAPLLALAVEEATEARSEADAG